MGSVLPVLSEADLKSLWKLLTTHVHKEHFCEGYLGCSARFISSPSNPLRKRALYSSSNQTAYNAALTHIFSDAI